MNARTRLLALPALLAIFVGSLFAESQPAMVVQVVTTENVDAYATKLVKANELVKAKAGYEKLRHLWVGDLAGDNTQNVYVVSVYPSAAAANALQEKLNGDREVDAFLAELKPMRQLGAAYLYKGVHLEGVYDGGAVFNTSINCTDEAAYLKALGDLRKIFDTAGFKDAHMSLWRAAAGRTTATHLVIISLPTQTRLGELIDAINDTPMMREWNAAAAKIRTTVQNGSYHEITK